MPTGRIKTLKSTYGFIKGDDGQDRFLLPNNMEKTGTAFNDLKEGQRVEFLDAEVPNPKPNQCRLRAIQCRVI